MMRIRRIHHVTLAVRDTESARVTFASLFGAEAADDDVVPAFGVRTRDITLGDATLQLAAPLEADSPLMRFIERKGEGFYNIALEVEDLDAAVAELAQRGVRVSDPVEATPGTRSAFISMTATHGLSIQLIETAGPADPAPEPNAAPPQDEEPSLLAADAPPASGAVEAAAAEKPPNDLTPDEWSDVD